MNADGARHQQIPDACVRIIAPSEQTCVVFGMPKEAIDIGAVDDGRHLGKIAAKVLDFDPRG
jgi:two-component system chemotaxis response regulator CheB